MLANLPLALEGGSVQPRVGFHQHLSDFLQPLPAAVANPVKIFNVHEVNQKVTHVCGHFLVPREFLRYQVREKPPEGVIGADAQPSSSWA